MEDRHIGEKHGRLLIVDKAEDYTPQNRKYKCVCDCGNIKNVRYSNLSNGHTKSCGCLRNEVTIERNKNSVKDITGQKFGYLTVIRRVENYISPQGATGLMYECRCDCGNVKILHKGSLVRGDIKSCGCMKNILNGQAHKLYNKYDFSNEYGIGYDANNREFYFDKEDYEKIQKYRWQVESDGYVTSTDRERDFAKVRMHRIIMGLYPGNSSTYVDHIHGSGSRFDNRKSNLRIVTPSQNAMNRVIKSTNTSGTTGVARDGNLWKAYITVDYKNISLGLYESLEDAIKARKEAEDKYFGEYSFRNSQIR